MKPANYLICVLAGSIAGGVWALVLVDFVPTWYENLGAPWSVVLLVLPLVLHMCLAFAFGWWRWRAAATYTALTLLLAVWGGIHNELSAAGNLSHISFVEESLFDLIALVLILLSWAVGRGLRHKAQWWKQNKPGRHTA